MYCFLQYGHIRTESGINFGANQFTLNTKNFQTKPGLGWNGGLSIRGNFTIIGTWFMVFNSAKQFYRRYKEQLLVNEDVNLKLASAQISH
jgi:hypothetical protein